MLRVIVKDRKGRVEPVVTKCRSVKNTATWQRDCIYCIQYFKGENPNTRWNHKRWERFDVIPWDDIEFEYSTIIESKPILNV